MLMSRISTSRRAATVAVAAGVAGVSLMVVSAHPVRGITEVSATAFVGSPTAGTDVPIPITWGTPPNQVQTNLSVVCFFAANTTVPRPDDDAWPRVTAVGFELPGTRSGFTLLSPQDEGWLVVENIPVATPRGSLTVDFALVAPVNPMGHSTRGPRTLLGIPPGQPSGRGNGTRFCVAGPFPSGLSIEDLINGVVVRFHGVQPHGPSIDVGVWDDVRRTIPLYP